MLRVSRLSSPNNLAVAAIAAFAVLPVHAGVVSPDLAAAMAARPGDAQRVIIQTAVRPASPYGLVPARLGGRVVKVFDRFPGYVAVLSSAAVNRLTATSGVRRISRDLPVTATYRKLPPSGYAGPWDEAARTVGADSVWYARTGVNGTGVRVAVLDTGIAPSPDYTIAGFRDFVNARPAPYDDNGHGTHVSGIVAGSGACSGGVQSRFPGIAPGATVIGVKVLDARASGYASTVIQGLDWCIANKSALGIGVINLSLGQSVRESATTDPLCQACERAVEAGITVVVAAGNNGDGYGGITCPANTPSVITVGATRTSGTALRSDDSLTTYTSRGPTMYDHYAKPDILAPGNRVVSVRAPGSLLDSLYPGNRVAPWTYGGAAALGARYFVLSGTSMAAPVVSGAAALVLSRRPGLSPTALKAALMASAQPVGGYDPVLNTVVDRYDWMTAGAGYLNIPGALRLGSALRVSSDETVEYVLADGWDRDTIQGESVLWGNTILWGNQAVRTGNYTTFLKVDWDRSVLWGDAYLWTTGLSADEDAVDSTSVLWGNHPSQRMAGLSVLLTGD